MLRRTFFILNNGRSVHNSPKHVALQADVGREVSMLRNVNEKLAELPIWEKLIYDAENNFFKMKEKHSNGEIKKFNQNVNLMQDVIARKKDWYSLEKAKITEKMLGLLREIKTEVAAEDAAVNNIKGNRK